MIRNAVVHVERRMLCIVQASLVKQCMEADALTNELNAFVHFVGASSASCNTVAMLRRFCAELSSRFQLPSVDIYADCQ
jgi:hypothetical protein